MSLEEKLLRLRELDKEMKLLAHTVALLGWDQETYMPAKALEERSEQLSLLSGILHERITSPEIGELLSGLGATGEHPRGDASLPALDRAHLRFIYRYYKRETKLPKRLVLELSKTTSIAQANWVEARKTSDFSRFSPHLKKLLALVKEKAECFGYEDHPYDALLDEYEPEMKTATVSKVFSRLQEWLTPFVEQIQGKPQVDDSFLHREFPAAKQELFGKRVITDMGYDFQRGRLDVSAHPFTTTLGIDDVRLTTRYNERFFNTALFGTIHEAGHGLYELGFSEEIRGTSLADGTSLGIHESQSRMWENMIGRSFAFWKHYFPIARDIFSESLGDVDVMQFCRAINKVEPSFIRIEADEVTYSLHIILRFNLEKRLTEGSLEVDDLPEAWRQESKKLLGIVPAQDDEGVLQDIHWSMGSIGYFPTYALGNLYGAQFFSAMKRAIPDVERSIEQGDFGTMLAWLRENIHRHGSVFTPEELVRRVTGEELNPDHFIRYVEDKFRPIYGL